MTDVRERLMTALQSAASHFNGGTADDEAVAKAAAAHDLNAHECQRLVEMYNTAKTVNFLKKAGDRAGVFPLADYDRVMVALAPAKAEAPKAAAPLGLYGWYDKPTATSIELPMMPKAAEQLDLNLLCGSAREQIDLLKAAARRCQDTAAEFELRYNRELEKLASAFSGRPDRFAEFEHAARHQYGPQVPTFIYDHIASRIPQVKRAAATPEPAVHTFSSEYPVIVDEVGKVASLAYHESLLREEADRLGKLAAGALRELDDALGIKVAGAGDEWDEMLGPKLAADGSSGVSPAKEVFRIQDLLLPPPEARKNMLSTQLGEGVSGAAGDYLKKNLTGALDSMKGGHKKEVANVTERLRNMKRQLILQELLATDPVLRAADPAAASSAYLAMVQTAPEVSLNKEVVRSQLRQAVQTSGGISPYDAKSMAELENELLKQINQPGAVEAPKAKV